MDSIPYVTISGDIDRSLPGNQSPFKKHSGAGNVFFVSPSPRYRMILQVGFTSLMTYIYSTVYMTYNVNFDSSREERWITQKLKILECFGYLQTNSLSLRSNLTDFEQTKWNHWSAKVPPPIHIDHSVKNLGDKLGSDMLIFYATSVLLSLVFVNACYCYFIAATVLPFFSKFDKCLAFQCISQI